MAQLTKLNLPGRVSAGRVGISRVDSPGSVGYLARVYRGGKTISLFFGDQSHGGSEAALRAAVAWRTYTSERFPPIVKVRTPHVKRVDSPEGGLVGWYAVRYDPLRRQRYFSDGAHGGTPAASRVVAERWAGVDPKQVERN